MLTFGGIPWFEIPSFRQNCAGIPGKKSNGIPLDTLLRSYETKFVTVNLGMDSRTGGRMLA